MIFKVSFLSETVSTLLAGVRLLSRVSSHVPFKGSWLSEAFSTLLAGEWPLSSVNSHVQLKFSFFTETPPTITAGETAVRFGFLSSFSYICCFSLCRFFTSYEIMVILILICLFHFIQILILLF